MNKVIHRNESYWGRSSVVVLAGGYALAMVSVLSDDPDVAVIHDLMVHESRRGKGLGRKLLKEAMAEAEPWSMAPGWRDGTDETGSWRPGARTSQDVSASCWRDETRSDAVEPDRCFP